MAVLVAIARAYHGMSAPLPRPNEPAVASTTRTLPYYALRTTLRMFAALAASLVFTFTYATLAAKSRRAEMVLIPLLDILQSVPILGFLSFTVTFFLGLFPGNVLGAECAAIFAIFTSQAWNMAFSFYQSLRTRAARSRRSRARLPPHRLAEVLAARSALRHARPDLEHDDVDVGRLVLRRRLRGDHRRRHHDHPAGRRLLYRRGQRRRALGRDPRGGGDDGASSSWLYDQLLFRPIVAWAGKFRVELSASAKQVERSWVLDLLLRTNWIRWAFRPLFDALRSVSLWRMRLPPIFPRGRRSRRRRASRVHRRRLDRRHRRRRRSGRCGRVVAYVATELTWADVGERRVADLLHACCA